MRKNVRKFAPVLILIPLLFILTGCGQDPVTKSGMLLDTVVTVTLYDGTQEDLDAAFTAISGWAGSGQAATAGRLTRASSLSGAKLSSGM